MVSMACRFLRLVLFNGTWRGGEKFFDASALGYGGQPGSFLPEPATVALLALGVLFLVARRRRAR